MKTQETWTDPIVEELRTVRREILREAGGHVRALGRWLMKSQQRHGKKLVTRRPRRRQS